MLGGAAILGVLVGGVSFGFLVYALALLARTFGSIGQNVLDTRSLWS
jgi:hypothetical protein